MILCNNPISRWKVQPINKHEYIDAIKSTQSSLIELVFLTYDSINDIALFKMTINLVFLIRKFKFKFNFSLLRHQVNGDIE